MNRLPYMDIVDELSDRGRERILEYLGDDGLRAGPGRVRLIGKETWAYAPPFKLRRYVISKMEPRHPTTRGALMKGGHNE